MPGRTEQDRNQLDERELKKLRAAINNLARLRVVAEQMAAAGATWRVGKTGGLEMVFVKQTEFVGLNIFGLHNVIGLKIVDRNDEFGEVRSRLLNSDRELAYMVRRQQANVAILTREEFFNWCQYYDQVESIGLVDSLGKRAYGFSGLERMTAEKLREAKMLLEKIVGENFSYLNGCGVAKVREVEGLDLAFLDGNGRLCSVPLSWIKQIKRRGQLGEETIEGQVKVVGVMYPHEGESKREFEERCLALENDYYKRYKTQIRVARGSLGQINLWRKLGFGSPRLSSYPEAGITPGDVWRYLYYGTKGNNLEPGPLAFVPGLSQPGVGDEFFFQGIDLVFLRRRGSGAQEYAPIDGLAAMDPHTVGRGSLGLVPLDNVVGIKIVPDSWSWEQIKNDPEIKRRIADAIYNMGIPGAHILFLNEDLLRLWKERGTPFYGQTNGVFKGDLQRAISYGRGLEANRRDLIYRQFRPGPEIGGDKKAITIRSSDTGDEVDVISDLGLSFGATPEGFNGIGKGPGTADGLMSLLRSGIIPMRPGWIAKEYILQTVYNRDVRGRENAFWAITNPKAVEKDYVAQFCIGELYVRYPHDQLRAKLPEKLCKAIIEQGPKYVKIWREDAQREVAAICPTHGHADHDALMAYVTEKAPIVAGAELLAYWKAKTMKTPTWRGRMTNVTLLSEPKEGSAYQIQPREMFPYYYSGKPVRVTEGVILWPYVCDHSLVSRMQCFEMNFNHSKTVLYNSGDWRMDRGGKTLRALEGSAKHKPDVIVMETTNMGGNEKPGESLTEEDVRDTYSELVKQSGNAAVIVVAPMNNLQRMYSLLEVAEQRGRRLAISPAHAEVERQLMAARELAPVGADGFDWVLPYDIGEGNLTVWQKPMTAPRRHQDDMFYIAASGSLGVLDAERLNEEGEKWIVVVSQYDILPYQFDRIYFPHGVDLLYSAPFLYNWQARTLAGANYGRNSDWIKQVGARVFMDMEIDGQGAGRVVSKRFDPKMILHVSGHPTPRQVVEGLDILIGPDRQKGVEIIDNMRRYNPADPLRSGFALPISGGNGVKVILNHGENPEDVARYLKRNLGKRRK